MSDNDREMLRLAAMAAGIVYTRADCIGLALPDPCPGNRYWNSRDDDGDCLRLAAKLRLTVNIEDHECEVFDQSGEFLCSIAMHNPTDEEVLAVVREAVTSAAAEIGRQMEGKDKS